MFDKSRRVGYNIFITREGDGDMAYMMVHLLVAKRWAEGHPEYLRSPEFYYGAISPDAIHVRDGNDKSHKNEIHLNNWGTFHEQDVLDYWHSRFSPFDVGYGVHVLTDAQWVPRYKRQLRSLFRPDGSLDVDLYFLENIATDFALRDETADIGEILDLIERAGTPQDHPLLTAYELNRWREVMVEAYRGPCIRQHISGIVTPEYVHRFVPDSIPLIDEVFAKI